MVLTIFFTLAFSFCLALACSNTFHHFLPLDLLIFSTPTASTNFAYFSLLIYLIKFSGPAVNGPYYINRIIVRCNLNHYWSMHFLKSKEDVPMHSGEQEKPSFQRVVMYKSTVSQLSQPFICGIVCLLFILFLLWFTFYPYLLWVLFLSYFM